MIINRSLQAGSWRVGRVDRAAGSERRGAGGERDRGGWQESRPGERPGGHRSP